MMGVIGNQFLRYLLITEHESVHIKLVIARPFLLVYLLASLTGLPVCSTSLPQQQLQLPVCELQSFLLQYHLWAKNM